VRRQPSSENEFFWDPEKREIDVKALEGVSVVINLSGESVFGRWTGAKKRRIAASRVQSARFLADTVNGTANLPELFISVSAVGYYGFVPGAQADENSPRGEGFLAGVCEEWEAAASVAGRSGARVVSLRLGVVLGKGGGTLGKMVPLFRTGLGGKLGDGSQPMPWIALPEIASIVNFIIRRKDISGAVNAVSPSGVTNAEFTASLARVLGRKAPFAVPAFVLRAVYGRMAEELLLGGVEVVPGKLLGSGYAFKHGELEKFLAAELSAR